MEKFSGLSPFQVIETNNVPTYMKIDYVSTVYSKGQSPAQYNTIVFYSTLFLCIMCIFCIACNGLRCIVFN